MSSSFQTEVEAYYKAKTPYTELLQQAMAREKPKNEPVQKSEPKPKDSPTKDEESSESNTKNLMDLLNLEGLTLNHEAVAKAAAAIKAREEKEAKNKGKPKGKK